MSRLSRPEATRLLRRVLAERVDPVLAGWSFVRRPASLAYTRVVDDGGRQRIEFPFTLRPAFAPDDVHLDPRMEVSFPDLDRIVRVLLGPDADLVERSSTIRVPLQLLAPRGSNVWLGRDESTIRQAVDKVLVELVRVLPGFARISSFDGLVEAATRRDPDVFVVSPPWPQVAVALALRGQASEAAALLRARYALGEVLDPRFRALEAALGDRDALRSMER